MTKTLTARPPMAIRMRAADLDALDALAKRENTTRSRIVRQALAGLLAQARGAVPSTTTRPPASDRGPNVRASFQGRSK